jgi:hypothetical protein
VIQAAKAGVVRRWDGAALTTADRLGSNPRTRRSSSALAAASGPSRSVAPTCETPVPCDQVLGDAAAATLLAPEAGWTRAIQAAVSSPSSAIRTATPRRASGVLQHADHHRVRVEHASPTGRSKRPSATHKARAASLFE